MSDNGRISLLFLLSLFLYFVAGEFNYFLGNWSLNLHVDALLIVFFGLYVSRVSSLLYASLLGFLADALHPSPHGVYVVGYLCLWLFFVWCQRHIRRQNGMHVRSVTAAAQIAWLLALTLFEGTEWLTSGAYWGRIVGDTLFSAAIAYVLAWPWCLFQKRFLYTLGWDLEAQPPRY